MLRKELGHGISLYRKVEVRGQLIRVGLLTPCESRGTNRSSLLIPFSIWVQGNKQVVRFVRKYPYAEPSHWSTLVSFVWVVTY